MKYQQFRDSISHNLNRLINGEKLSFTHSKFFGWRFEVTAKRDVQNER